MSSNRSAEALRRPNAAAYILYYSGSPSASSGQALPVVGMSNYSG